MNNRHLVLVVAFILLLAKVNATHIWGGELTYKVVSAASLTYEFTLTGYIDTGSPVRFGDGIINFGDGTEAQIDLVADSYEDNEFLGPNNRFNLYRIKITHTYAAPGTYEITYTEPNRNDEIININLGNSVQTPFLIKSLIIINPEFGLNSSPIFNTFPIDFGFVGKIFTHNPWAWDPDGDSLAYRLVTPKMDPDQPVTNYLTPSNSEFYVSPLEWDLSNESGNGPAQYKINPFTGDLSWDAPGNLLRHSVGDFSEYNLALLVEEWRQINGSWRRIGYVTRDFLVMVTAEEIGRPDFELPEDRMMTASESVQETITFQDPDGDPIKVEFFGEVFDLPNSPMMVSPLPADFTNGPLAVSLQWAPLAWHVRQRPYYVHVKITDQPTDSRTDPAVTYKTWILSFATIPDVVTGLPVSPDQSKFIVYPNPTSGKLRWQIPANSEPEYLTIYNCLGQRTISVNLTSNGVKEIDVSSLVNGVYLLQLTDGSRKYQIRFLKND
ncbi:MAG: hypothetical protein DHS20C17_26350 [Cyclobacteriaceae bacterium]|nr:MAG: hypothetical protein DHS20C17_26350 [Cyclobacteriaceae bacterium]